MLHPAPVAIDLQGHTPHVLHQPVVIAQAQPSTRVAYWLLDTGYSKAGTFVAAQGRDQFTANAPDATARLGPTTAVQPFPTVVTYGISDVVVDPNHLARAMQLGVTRDYFDGVSAAYLLGPANLGNVPPYPNRLVAFWTLPGAQHSTITATQEQLQDLQQTLGVAVTFYTTPVSLVPPGHMSIPAVVANEVSLPTFLIDHIPHVAVTLVSPPHNNANITAVWDTGASYTVVNRDVADFYGLNKATGSRIVLPQLLFPTAQPPLTLQNVPAVVDNDYDMIVIGSTVADHFSTNVLDFGTGIQQLGPITAVQGTIRLIP